MMNNRKEKKYGKEKNCGRVSETEKDYNSEGKQKETSIVKEGRKKEE